MDDPDLKLFLEQVMTVSADAGTYMYNEDINVLRPILYRVADLWYGADWFHGG